MNTIRVKNREAEPRSRAVVERARKWLGVDIVSAMTVDLYLIDFSLSSEQLSLVEGEILVDPVIQEGFRNYRGADFLNQFDWLIQVGLKSGMKDGEGERAKSAIEDLLGDSFEGKVYTATEYLLSGNLTREDCQRVIDELLANPLVHRTTLLSVGKDVSYSESLNEVPRVSSDGEREVRSFALDSLSRIADRRNLALSEDDIQAIRRYYQDPEVQSARAERGLSEQITDVELEAIAQTQSEHCKHKIFNAEIDYRPPGEEDPYRIDSLMDTYIKAATREMDRDWVLSTFWDNAGVVEFDEDHAVALKFETHNSPSAKEPYGGAITGIVGVYRDPMGTGQGCKIIAGAYGFCTPDPFYDGDLNPEIKPRRLLEGIVDGVKDGGNKSGVPTITGYSKYDNSFLGKPLVYVGALGLMPRELDGQPAWHKDVENEDRIVMIGGRVGRDGIHGVTESSLEFGEHITSGHVQIGDPFTQKKVQDLILEARDRGLYKLIWDLGGGGLSSAVGETAEFSDGCLLDLSRIPLKYEGLNPWEILVSESQERMLLGVSPDHVGELRDLARKHDVEITDIGKFTDSGKFHIKDGEQTVAYLDLDFLHNGFPGYQLPASWSEPDLQEPDLDEPEDQEELLLRMLSRENVCSKEWIQRQYDHEVQGTSVIKPLVGKNPVQSDGSVIQPLAEKDLGIALGLGNSFKYSQIDPYWMAASSLDEAIRRVLAVGGSLDHLALNDNFCWPNSIYDPDENPEGERNLGALVRANQALYRFTKAFRTPCISGKDSMFIDGNLRDSKGNLHKVSGLPALQFSAIARVPDVNKSVDLVPQRPGDIVYILGVTRDELGASEYYEMLGHVGANVPRLREGEAESVYQTLEKGIREEAIASCHGCYRGGIGTALAQMAIAGEVGIFVKLKNCPTDEHLRTEKVLYSESPARFLVTVPPSREDEWKRMTSNVPCNKIGAVVGDSLTVKGTEGSKLIDLPVEKLVKTYQSTFEGF
ncbi:MAG: AIR synthase-related protein [Candidatus Acetothermia bacterium]